MLIVHAHINAPPYSEEPGKLPLIEYCHSQGLKPPVYAKSADALENLLNSNLDSSVLLFSNFPPNCSYPENRKADYSYKWDADSYTISQQLFTVWATRYPFREICFITGAPADVLSDQEIQNCIPGIPHSIIRKKRWIHESVDYQKVYTTYMKEMIRKYYG